MYLSFRGLEGFLKSGMSTFGSKFVTMLVVVDLKLCNICSYVEIFRLLAEAAAHGYTEYILEHISILNKKSFSVEYLDRFYIHRMCTTD